MLVEATSYHIFPFELTIWGGAYEVLNYRITLDFFENYCNTVVKFLYEYRYRRVFYQKLCFTVTVSRVSHESRKCEIGTWRPPIVEFNSFEGIFELN